MLSWNPRDPLLITAYIYQKRIHPVLIDNGSSTNIIYEHCSHQSPAPWKEGLKPLTMGPLIGFTGHQLWQLGTINLPLTLVSLDGKQKPTSVIEFSVVCCRDDDDMLPV